jgi:cellulose biosynthesis protein BcsQ
VVVDLDPQASLTRALLYERNKPEPDGRLRSLLDSGHTLAAALDDRLNRKKRPVDAYLTHGIGPAGFAYTLLANESQAWDVERKGLRRPGEVRLKTELVELITELAGKYKYVLVDAPPGQTVLAEAAIQRSDLLLCPITPDRLSYWGLESFDEYLRELFEARESRPPARFIFTRFKSKVPQYHPQNEIFAMVSGFSPLDKYVTLLSEAGERSVIGGQPITLPDDPRLASRLEGPPRPGRTWALDRIYTKSTRAELKRLALAVKEELYGGRSSVNDQSAGASHQAERNSGSVHP